MSFAHLHVHTEYSMLDGFSNIKKLVKRVKELDMPAVAITDHGNIHAAWEFQEKAKKAGIKPILGMEAYVAPGDRRGRSRRDGPRPRMKPHVRQHFRDLLELAAAPGREPVLPKVLPAYHFYAAAVAWERKDEDRARAELARYFEFQPEATIDPGAYPKSYCIFFDAQRTAAERRNPAPPPSGREVTTGRPRSAPVASVEMRNDAPTGACATSTLRVVPFVSRHVTNARPSGSTAAARSVITEPGARWMGREKENAPGALRRTRRR